MTRPFGYIYAAVLSGGFLCSLKYGFPGGAYRTYSLIFLTVFVVVLLGFFFFF